VKYGTLEVTTPTGTISSLLGNNGEFELDGLSEGRWTGQVESDEGDCQVQIDVPATKAVVQYLGTLRCLEGAASSPVRPAP
jgi:hypothetical protein